MQGEIVINKTIGNTFSDRIQRSKARKEHKRTAVSLTDVAQNPPCQFIFIVRVIRFRHGAIDDQRDQARVVKRTSKLQRLRIVAPKANGGVPKVTVACCECGASEHHALVLRKEMFAQNGPDIHRRTHHGHVGTLAAASLLADLHPVHAPRERLRQEITRTRGVRLGARSVGIQLKLISLIGNAVAQHA